MSVQYKQKCSRCKKNYVLTTPRQSYIICYECQKGSLKGKITDPKFKKLFDIPEEYYKKNGFLRSIKANYLKYQNLTEKQLDAFKKVVAKMNEDREMNS